jgi:hypothetical protein
MPADVFVHRHCFAIDHTRFLFQFTSKVFMNRYIPIDWGDTERLRDFAQTFDRKDFTSVAGHP